MNRAKRGFLFWALLLLTVFQFTGDASTKKIYKASIADASGAPLGASIIIDPQGLWTAHTFPGKTAPYAVQMVWLANRANTWQIPLCVNGGPIEDDCEYDAEGNLEVEGYITADMLIAAGVPGPEWRSVKTDGNLAIVISDGTSVLGWGYYARIF